MAERPSGDLVDLLLERDVPLDDGRYSRHRRNLDDRLQKAKRDERVVRIATILIWAGALSFFPLALALQRIAPRGGLPAGLLGDVVVPAATLFAIACGALAIPMLAFYLVRCRQVLDRTRDDVRDAVLLDLKREVERCKAGLEGRDKSS
jgi:hypothetical protein